MIISVDNRLKRKIQIETRKQRRGIYYLWLFEKLSFAATLAWIVVFPIYCRVTGTYVYLNPRTGKLDYFLVSMLTSVYGSMALAAVLFIYVLRVRLEHVFIGGRVAEQIEIDVDKMVYAFRIKYQTPEDKRNIVIIDLSRVSKLSYNEELAEISIDGMMIERTIKASTNVHRIDISNMAHSSIKINDYFTPSLYEVLKSNITLGGLDE